MSTATAQIPATRNEAHGFFKTIADADTLDAAAAWPAAFAAIAAATQSEPDAVRAFLDSRHGRHFADTVVEKVGSRGQPLDAAVAGAVAQWMEWKISRRTSRDTGIPAGLPYLIGHVEHEGFCVEA